MMMKAISHRRSNTVGDRPMRKRRPSLFKRITAALTMMLLAVVAAGALATPAKAADDDQANYSFYKLSSSLAAFFSNGKSPDEKAEAINQTVWESILKEPGNSGSMLGYVDPDFSFSLEFLNSQISGSSAAVGYSTLLENSQNGGAGGSKTPGMLDYAHFGATLNAMGLDSMGTGLSLNFLAPLGGGLILLLFVLTGVVDLLFSGVIETLKALNPFKLFYEGVKAINPTFAEGMTGGQAPPGFLGGLSSWIRDWYQALNNMSWAVLVPLFIAVTLLGLLLSKKMNRGGALKKLVIRIVFIGVGLPLIGSMYTGVLNSMGEVSKSGSAGSTQVVLSTYVDFQNWAFKSRLYVPEKAVIEWDATDKKPTQAALENIRATALEINKATNSDWKNIQSSLNVAQSASWTDAAMKDTQGGTAGGVGGYMATIDLLGRYISGAKIDAASYETAVKGDISTSAPYTDGPDGKKQVSEWFSKFGDPKDGLPDIDDAAVVAGNPVISVASGTGLQASPAGATSGTKKYTSSSTWNCESWVTNSRGEPLNCNMSTLAMYNYLNTSFGADSMTMYSSNKATSGATREMHNAVTPVGTGVMGGLYWANSAVLLASFAIIGLGYAFSMLFTSIRRGFQMITAIPFATIGAISGIAKVIIYTASMILGVLVTLFMYKFIQVFLISLPQIVEMPFSTMLNGVQTGDLAVANLISGGTLPTVMTLLSIITLIMFTVMAMRVRKAVLKAINEAVTKLIDKFMDTTIAPPGGGGMMPALAGAVAGGAGMAAANKAMNGGFTGARKPGPEGSGPGGIQVGQVPSPSDPGGAGGGRAPQGSLSIGGGSSMDLSGAMGGPGPDGRDGTSGTGSPDGHVGGPLALSAGPGGLVGDTESDRATAKAVEAQGGLSAPGSQGGGDVIDTMAGSMERTQGQYAAKDRAALDGAVSTGKAAVKGVEAAGRGAAGDVPGAVAAGAVAASHIQDAHGHARTAQSIQEDIDSPLPSNNAAVAAAGPGASTRTAGNSGTASSAKATGKQAKTLRSSSAKAVGAVVGGSAGTPKTAVTPGVKPPQAASQTTSRRGQRSTPAASVPGKPDTVRGTSSGSRAASPASRAVPAPGTRRTAATKATPAAGQRQVPMAKPAASRQAPVVTTAQAPRQASTPKQAPASRRAPVVKPAQGPSSRRRSVEPTSTTRPTGKGGDQSIGDVN
ncbi:hypothetical protein ANMWB30_23270 [Arthrobacter sp. MWB30]|nr:hypothetical protein ANMWB30_23270 [Arthrobacter sp. MWB30]